MLAKSKLDSIETLVSQAFIDMEISHEEFNAIIREEKNMRGWKKMWECQWAQHRWKTKKYEIESVNSRKITSL